MPFEACVLLDISFEEVKARETIVALQADIAWFAFVDLKGCNFDFISVIEDFFVKTFSDTANVEDKFDKQNFSPYIVHKSYEAVYFIQSFNVKASGTTKLQEI